MRILIIGGGPAGLAFSMLMAGTDRTNDITLLERSQSNEDPGWGVTLRLETLSFLGLEKLIGSKVQLLEGRALRYRNDLLIDLPNPGPCGLCTLSRSALLQALYGQAEKLGVKICFGTDGAQLDEAEIVSFDLVAAADGANSPMRRRHEDWFQPSIGLGKNFYVWLAAEIPFHKLTILLVDKPVPLLAWGYKYASMRSTFIVECAENACQSSGLLHQSPEDVCRSLEATFSRELSGYPIITSKTLRWRQFATVSCRQWHYGNIALIGDAAHTAHFSQGFGTMLAFDDALALHTALTHSQNVECALNTYQTVQKPKVDSLQQAASTSMQWAESILDSVSCHDQERVSELIAARWPNNSVTPGPLQGARSLLTTDGTDAYG